MSAQVTEAHRKLAADLCRHATGSNRALHHVPKFAQLIADSEARAIQESLARLREAFHVPVIALCDQLRTEVEQWELAFQEQFARAELAEAEVERLKADGAATAFVNMACRASRAETDRNNLRADLDAIKAILNEEKGRAERAEAEVATEREKLDWVFQNCKVEANDYTTGNRDVYYVHDREDLGAAMKEGK